MAFATVSDGVEFRILGPLEASDAGRPLRLGGPKQRALLALLVLSANEVVTTERLVDELWGEDAPPTAAKIVQNSVSQLRKLLDGEGAHDQGAGAVITRDGGYALRVRPGELDLDQYERFVDAARAARAAGDLADASAGYHAGLALWRGSALADLDFAPTIHTESGRLEEHRLAVVEERIEVDLDLGRHRDLIGELEALVRRHPLRERPRALLMLALYRCGRQAEALSAYRDARRFFVDELGLEPSAELQELERAILRHDPSLELGDVQASAGAGVLGETDASGDDKPRSRRLHAVLGALVVLLLAGGTVVLVGVLRGSVEDAFAANAVAFVPIGTSKVVRTVTVGAHPTSIAAGAGYVWVLNADDQTISRIQPRTGSVRTIAVGSIPKDIAAGEGALWVGAQDASSHPSTMTTLLRIDARSGVVTRTIKLPHVGPIVTGFGSSAGGQTIAVAHGSVWVVNPDLTVSRIDPRTGRIVALVRSVKANTLAVGEDAVWIAGLGGRVSKIDPGTNGVTLSIDVPTVGVNAVAVGDGSVWASDPLGSVVWRIDPGPTKTTMRTIPVGPGAAAISYGHGAVWVASSLEKSVARIDPRTNTVDGKVRTGHPALGVTSDSDGIWVTVGGPTDAAGLGPATTVAGEDLGVRGPSCGEVYYEGKGRPRHVIVSDLPLQGRSRSQALSIVEAIRLVLREQRFKAGPYTIGYQSCDDSTAQAQTFEHETCASNARSYVESDVLAVIGAYNSDCSFIQIPITNEAPGGPLLMLSPANSAIGLTHAAPSHPPRELERLYPTGRRNFARVYPADDAQAAGLALFARERGFRRIFVLEVEGSGYAVDTSTAFETAARRLGLRLVGARTWDERASDYELLSQEVADARPDAVVLVGWIGANGGRLIRDLRASLGPSTALLGTDGFTKASDVLESAGTAAEGMYASVPGTPPERLGMAGRQFVKRFRASVPPWLTPDYYWAPYAAQAAEALLDAIAASNGTREGVLESMRSGTARPGTLGNIRFDDNGDVVAAPITILRIHRGGPGFTSFGPDFADGSVVADVVRPPRRLYG